MKDLRLPGDLETSEAPRQRWRWTRRCLPRRWRSFFRGVRKRWQRLFLKLEEPYHSVFTHTQVHLHRQRNLVRLAERIDRERVPGDVVECGVLDGGTAALVAWATRHSRPPRSIHLFDSWEGLPQSTEQDGAAALVWSGQVIGSPARVARIMRTLGIEKSRIRYHRGWFDQVFPTVDIRPVALVHVDCDFYEPTRLCLEKWYPCLAPGGFMQFDDYDAFLGCHKAVNGFLADHPELRMETDVGNATAYYVRKPD